MTGQRPARLDSGPEIPFYFLPAWNSFNQLHARRSSSGFGPNPISWPDLHAWIEVEHRGIRPDDWVLDTIQRLDAEYLRFTGETEAERQRAAKKSSDRPRG